MRTGFYRGRGLSLVQLNGVCFILWPHSAEVSLVSGPRAFLAGVTALEAEREDLAPHAQRREKQGSICSSSLDPERGLSVHDLLGVKLDSVSLQESFVCEDDPQT